MTDGEKRAYAELRTFIETGPLAAALAPHWADTFPREPEPPDVPRPEGIDDGSEAWVAWQARRRWLRISYRFGLLTPDALHHLVRLLGSLEGGRQVTEADVQAAKAVQS